MDKAIIEEILGPQNLRACRPNLWITYEVALIQGMQVVLLRDLRTGWATLSSWGNYAINKMQCSNVK